MRVNIVSPEVMGARSRSNGAHQRLAAMRDIAQVSCLSYRGMKPALPLASIWSSPADRSCYDMDCNRNIGLSFNAMARIARDKWFSPGIRQTYWNFIGFVSEVGRLFGTNENSYFRRHVFRDQWRYLTRSSRPVSGENVVRAQAAVRWLLHAQAATPDEGVSLGFFPCRGEGNGWMPSYPETTGYIITTLLAYADRFHDAPVREAALKMAHWEIAVQMPSGAVQGGPVCVPTLQTAAAFNTGMVLDGWCSSYSATGDSQFLDAARRAADFLVGDLDENGYFRTNGAYVSADEVKTYTCLCAWPMYRFGQISGEHRYEQVAIRIIDAALLQQQSNGWFSHNCLTHSHAPLTHTIGYTLQGVLEVGLMAQRADYIQAAIKAVDSICTQISWCGLLPGRFYSDWEPASFSSCLTGNAQIAVVCFRLHEYTGATRYREAADTLVNSLKALQLVDAPSARLNGAIAGSFPIFGEYMRAGYPNWATKYFIDALMLQYHLGKFV